MFKYKAKIKTLTAELSRTKKQLCKANEELEMSKEYAKCCWEDYWDYVHKCSVLEKEIEDLKKENKNLELTIKAFKAVEKAHKQYNCNKKEA